MNTEPITQAELDEWKKRGFYSERNKEIVDRLIAEVERLKKPIEPIELEFYRELCKTVPPGGHVGVLRENAERLIRELDSLRRDKERLDWLENGSSPVDPVDWSTGRITRNSIDAAIARERKEKT